ncbi:hypothetical protein ACJIZ3_017884 [Penstemon smallii]|uniref:Uncharacterized protein n=1 Tax=Penstemon smallii TaxID=265156 RepID=A0ABD3SWU7_9LAMI
MSADSELILSSSTSNHSSFFGSSSSGGFSTPFGSELGSSESEDGEFIAQLTQQMAECMFQEEEEEGMHEKDLNSIPNSVFHEDFESIQHKQRHNKTEQYYMQNRGIGHGRKGQNGFGMQAFFLGGSGSRNGSSGTGVFFPRVNNDPTELKEKPGCSTVLIPTRVLQILELHFNKRLDPSAPPLSGGPGSRSESPKHKDGSTRSNGQQNRQSQLKNRPTNHVEEMQLPQEWTY